MTGEQFKAAWPFIESKFCDILLTGGSWVKDVYIEGAERDAKDNHCIKLGTGELIKLSSIRKIKLSN